MDANRLHAQEGGLEECPWTQESFVVDGDPLSNRQLIAHVQGEQCSINHFLLKVQDNIAQLLPYVTHSCVLSCGGEADTTLSQDLHEVVCQVLVRQKWPGEGHSPPCRWALYM